MSVLWWVVGTLAILVGLAGLFLPAVPGAPLVLLGIVAVAWADRFARIGPWTLVTCAILALLASAVDWTAGVLGAKRLGATRWGLLGATLGLLVGMFFGVAGLLLGPALGAAAFEYWKDPDFKRALKAGAGAALGYLVGIVAKCALVLTMLGLAVLAYVL